MVGATIVARSALGVQPTSMKNAVNRPQAMSAGMLGMIMFDRKVPNFCTLTRALGRCEVVTVAIVDPFAEPVPRVAASTVLIRGGRESALTHLEVAVDRFALCVYFYICPVVPESRGPLQSISFRSGPGRT